MRARVTLLLALALTGCQAPRIFQSKVPEPVRKPESTIEAERQAADLIARKIEKPEELKPVAASLSASLGAPKVSLVDVKVFDLPKASKQADDGLRDGMLDMQRQLQKVNLKLEKLQGKEIEGTGISLLGPGMATIVIGLIVLGVVFPPAFTLMAFAFRRLKSTAGIIVDQIDQASKDPQAQDAMKSLKSQLNAKMDLVHKQVVHALQKPTDGK